MVKAAGDTKMVLHTLQPQLQQHGDSQKMTSKLLFCTAEISGSRKRPQLLDEEKGAEIFTGHRHILAVLVNGSGWIYLRVTPEEVAKHYIT